MAIVRNTAEAGVAAGTQVDATNSAVSGKAFAIFAAPTVITYSATAGSRGTRGIQVAAAASTSTYFGWDNTSITGATNACAAAVEVYLPALPGAASQPIMYFRSGTGGTGLFVVQLQASTGKLFLTSDAAGGATQGAVATTGLSATTWYRVEVWAINNTGGVADSFAIKVYALSAPTTELTALGTTSSAANLGTSAIGSIRFGRPAAIGAAYTAIFDNPAFQTGSSTLIGPTPSNSSPTAGAGSDQTGVAIGATVTLTGTDSDTDGTIVTRAWTQTAGSPTVTLSGASTATATFTAPSVVGGTTLTFQYTATDNEGASTSDTMTVSVVAPVSNVAPTSGAGTDQTNIEPWATVTLSGSDSDSDGTVVTRTWAQTAGSPTVTLAGSGATRTFTAPPTIAGTTLTFTYTVTDNGGASSTPDPMTVTVLPVTERAAIGGVEVPMQIREN